MGMWDGGMRRGIGGVDWEGGEGRGVGMRVVGFM